jgi:hypothetical protein
MKRFNRWELTFYIYVETIHQVVNKKYTAKVWT